MLPPDLLIEESLFQIVHVADTLQTLQIPDRKGLYESSNVLDGGLWIGHKPSRSAIELYMGGEAIAHALVSYELYRHAPPWMSRVWEVTTISVDALTVEHNAHLGLAIRF